MMNSVKFYTNLEAQDIKTLYVYGISMLANLIKNKT